MTLLRKEQQTVRRCSKCILTDTRNKEISLRKVRPNFHAYQFIVEAKLNSKFLVLCLGLFNRLKKGEDIKSDFGWGRTPYKELVEYESKHGKETVSNSIFKFQ
jgi:hypothetical protein